MKKKIQWLLVWCCTAVFLNCKEQPSKRKEETKTVAETEVVKSRFPEALVNVLNGHGGLEAWNKKRTLQFELPNDKGGEVHTIDLRTRKDKVTMRDVSMGFDGTDVWVLDEKNNFKGDAVFYHNLMFYFYAMPFVLADEGIQYDSAKPIIFEDYTYPGIRIAYNNGVGTSPKDEYFLHYDPKTFQMEWLGYTVTYGTGEKSDTVKWIRYEDWMEVSGLRLPKKLTWYSNTGQTMETAKSSRIFENVRLDTTEKPDTFYALPKGGTVVDDVEGL
ncbi:DUF6503 family protein [Maribacter sp. 2-571]|uniref:DUF6503 family protein n=1 Tax=Maribacter sp. 2-571 TaxID=3417569 RepID=UPI003D358ABE